MSEQRRFWRDCADAQARLKIAARIGYKYQIRLTRSIYNKYIHFGSSLFKDQNDEIILAGVRQVTKPTKCPVCLVNSDQLGQSDSLVNLCCPPEQRLGAELPIKRILKTYQTKQI